MLVPGRRRDVHRVAQPGRDGMQGEGGKVRKVNGPAASHSLCRVRMVPASVLSVTCANSLSRPGLFPLPGRHIRACARIACRP